MKILSLAEKKNSCDALKVLMFLTFLGVSEGSGCLHTPVPVPICPQSSYQWYIKAKEFCSDHRNYHCLITELGKKDPNYTIECCMKPEKISKGHMPRYNFNKQVLQEIECESDYFMPVSFDSNKYRQNGVEHCNNKKSKCTNMEGLKVCTEGSTTMDGTCYCDYKNMYVPELPLPAGEFCFKEQHNNCHLRQKCEKPDQTKPQELNMMYECVDVCPDGQYRPEMTLACEDIVQSTTLSFNITSQLPSQVPVQTPTKVPILVTTNDMKKTIDQGTSGNKNVIIIMVALTICLAVGGATYAVIMVYRALKKVPLIEVHKSIIHAQREHTCSIRCTLKDDTVLYEVTDLKWVKLKNEENADEEEVSLTETESKYGGSKLPLHPSLLIKNVSDKDKAFYRCKITYKMKYQLPCRSEQLKEKSTTYVYLNVLDGNSNYAVDTENFFVGDRNTVVYKTKDGNSNYAVDTENFFVGDRNTVVYKTKDGSSGSLTRDEDFLQMSPVASKVNLEESCEVNLGDTAILKVNLADKRDISDIKWYRKESPDSKSSGTPIEIVKKGHYHGSHPEYPSLTIRKTKKKDEGFYSCSVLFKGATEDAVYSNAIFLVVKAKNPKIENNNYFREVNKAYFGKDTKIVMEAKADSSDGSEDEDESSSNKNDQCETQNQTSPQDVRLDMERDKLHANQQNSAMRQQQPQEPVPLKNNHLKDMEDLALRHNFGVQNVAGDGNCLYHAASEQMGTLLNPVPPNERANELRHRLVNFLRQHPTTPQGESYSKWLTTNNETWEQYLDRMSKPGEFGDEIIIRALCHCFALKVCVLSTLNPDKFSTYEPQQGHEESGSHVVHLGHIHSGLHYVRLIPLQGNKVKSSTV